MRRSPATRPGGSQLDLLFDAEIDEEVPGSGALRRSSASRRLCFRTSSIRISCCSGAWNCTAASGARWSATWAGARAARGPCRARPSFLPQRGKAKGARYLMLPAIARAAYANDDAIRHYQQALAACGRPTSRAGAAHALRAHRRFVPSGRPARDRAENITNVLLRAYRLGRSCRGGADHAQDRRALVGRRPARSGRGTLCRGAQLA